MKGYRKIQITVYLLELLRKRRIVYLIIIVQMQKNRQRIRMEEKLANINIFQDHMEELELDELFEESKRLISELKKQELREGRKSMDQRLSQLSHFVYKKLNQRSSLELQTYIGLLSIFSYICSSAKHFCTSLNFQNCFYRNLNTNTKKAYQKWAQSQGTLQEQASLIHLSTILFILCTFTEFRETQHMSISSKKIFNKSMIATLLNMKLPNKAKILKNYKMLVLYLYKIRPHCFQNISALSTIIYNLNHSQITDQGELALIYILQKIDFQYDEQLGKIWEKVIPRLRKLLLENSDFTISRILLRLMEKIRKVCSISLFELSGENIYSLIQKNNQMAEKLCDLGQIIPLLIQKLPDGDKKILMNKFEADQQNIALEVYELCLRNIKAEFLMQIIENNFLTHLITTFSKIQDNTGDKKMFLRKILQNLLKQGQSKTINMALMNQFRLFNIEIQGLESQKFVQIM